MTKLIRKMKGNNKYVIDLQKKNFFLGYLHQFFALKDLV